MKYSSPARRPPLARPSPNRFGGRQGALFVDSSQAPNGVDSDDYGEESSDGEEYPSFASQAPPVSSLSLPSYGGASYSSGVSFANLPRPGTTPRFVPNTNRGGAAPPPTTTSSSSYGGHYLLTPASCCEGLTSASCVGVPETYQPTTASLLGPGSKKSSPLVTNSIQNGNNEKYHFFDESKSLEEEEDKKMSPKTSRYPKRPRRHGK